MSSAPATPTNLAKSSAWPALELRGIDKNFGTIHANRAVSLTIAKGTIHGLVGENGAGKSTLANIIHGHHRPDSGEIILNGGPVRFRDPRDAIAAGIGMVHQHFKLVDTFTVVENVILGSEPSALLQRSLSEARRQLERLARDHGLSVPLDQAVGDLPVGVRQRTEILKTLYRHAEILILDEPTAVLTPQETDHLFGILNQLRLQGKTILLVTHKLREIMEVTDHVTVMRQGAVVAQHITKDTSPAQLAEEMVGRSFAPPPEKAGIMAGAVVLSAQGVFAVDDGGVSRVREVGFDLRGGEILGIAGVSGNGQTELLEVLAGMRPLKAGKVSFKGKDLAPCGPKERRDLGVAYVPEDRLRFAMVEEFSAKANAVLGYQGRPRYSRMGFMRGATVAADCARWMTDFDVRPVDPELRLGAFSGGNQQKQVLAREIGGDPDVLLLGQPTRGVDIGAIELIHRRILALRAAGKAILLVSVELEEILALSDRILVMNAGSIVGELARSEATEARLGLLMAGLKKGVP